MHKKAPREKEVRKPGKLTDFTLGCSTINEKLSKRFTGYIKDKKIINRSQGSWGAYCLFDMVLFIFHVLFLG